MPNTVIFFHKENSLQSPLKITSCDNQSKYKGGKTMVSLKQAALTLESKPQVKNISELPNVPVDLELEDREATNADG